MRFGRGVDQRMSVDTLHAFIHYLREFHCEGQGECREVGLIATAGEGAVERTVPADALADPAHRFLLDL